MLEYIRREYGKLVELVVNHGSTMVDHARPWSAMGDLVETWQTTANHGRPSWSTMVDNGRPRTTMVDHSIAVVVGHSW
jgi:hypothetical protein